jgi:hypothetical protein
MSENKMYDALDELILMNKKLGLELSRSKADLSKLAILQLSSFAELKKLKDKTEASLSAAQSTERATAKAEKAASEATQILSKSDESKVIALEDALSRYLKAKDTFASAHAVAKVALQSAHDATMAAKKAEKAVAVAMTQALIVKRQATSKFA